MFKLAFAWAINNSILDFTIRLLHILSHLVWSFYLSDSASIGAFIWMTWFNTSFSLFTYMEIKLFISSIVCGIGSWWIFSWMWIWNCISEYWDTDIQRSQEQQNNELGDDQEPNHLHNQRQERRYLFLFENLSNLALLVYTKTL